MSGLDNEMFVVGQMARKTTEANVRKYDQACKVN